MTTIHRAESNDPEIGGVIVTFPSGIAKSAAWKSQAPIPDTLEAAKAFVAAIVESMLKDGRVEDLGRTNIASLVAAVQRHILDWNELRRRALYAVH